MSIKTCFKCGNEKPLSDFYVHPKMADGYLGKCKTCTKTDSKNRRLLKEATDPDWVEKESIRHKKKNRKRNLEKRGLPIDFPYRARKPKKQLRLQEQAKQYVNNAIRDGRFAAQPCEICGKKAHAHHEDYSKFLDVVWLCPKHHSARHVHLWNSKLMGATPMPISEFLAVIKDSPF